MLQKYLAAAACHKLVKCQKKLFGLYKMQEKAWRPGIETNPAALPSAP